MNVMSNEDRQRQALDETLSYFDGDSLASDVFMKYALRDNADMLLETNPDQMHRRLAREFARIESKYANPMPEQEIYELLKDFGLIVPQGSPMAAIGNPHQVMSISNCFVIDSPHDSYAGILRTDEEQVQIMKRRGGVGFDISTIRPSGTVTKNAARTSDGIAVFMERFSNSCREVAQGGRRGALLLSISCNHPDIETFIDIKRDRKKVTGANISIRFTDEFMNAVESDSDYVLRWPCDLPPSSAKVSRIVKARRVWEKFIDAAWESAEPGAFFWDTILRETPADCYAGLGFRTQGSNPCVVGATVVRTTSGPMTVKDMADHGAIDVLAYDEISSSVCTKKAVAFMTRIDAETVIVSTTTGRTITVTPDHRVFVRDGFGTEPKWTSAGDIRVGQEILEALDGGGTLWTSISSIAPGPVEDVYDLIVDSVHNFFADGLLVHNCGELVLCPYDSCRLLVVNLFSFVTDKFRPMSAFDFERFGSVTKKAQRLMDDMVDLEIEAIDKIIVKIKSDPEPDFVKRTETELWEKIRAKCVAGRRTGLGVTGLGDALAALGHRYGSPQSVVKTEDIFKRFAAAAHTSSCELAAERGPFPIFDYALEQSHPYLNRVMDLAGPTVKAMWAATGRRNIALTTVAPGGSVSTLTQTTSGIEPVYTLTYKRRRKVTPNDFTSRVDYVDPMGDKWTEYIVKHHGLQVWMDTTGLTDVESSPYFKATSNDIDWVGSVDIQAAAQRYISHSLSKTCNLPTDVTRDIVSDVYMRAWRSGCKGFTVYRAGSRTGVLVESEAIGENKHLDRSSKKRPKNVSCDIHRMRVKNEDDNEQWLALVGLVDGEPYEVFCGKAESIVIPRSYKRGFLDKNGKRDGVATYNLRIPVEDDELVFKDVVNLFDNSTQGTFTRTLSLSLRHGVPVNYIVEQLQKDKKGDMYSFARVLARVLKDYIHDGTRSTEKSCPDCGGGELIYQEGCVRCSCGYTRCS